MPLPSELICKCCGVRTKALINTDGTTQYVFPCECSDPLGTSEYQEVADAIWNIHKQLHFNSAKMWASHREIQAGLDPWCSRKNKKWEDWEYEAVRGIDNIFSAMDVSNVCAGIKRNPFSIFNIYMHLAYKQACAGNTVMYDRAINYLN